MNTPSVDHEDGAVEYFNRETGSISLDTREEFMARMCNLAYRGEASRPQYIKYMDAVEHPTVFRRRDGTPTDMIIYEPLTNTITDPIMIGFAGTHTLYQFTEDINILMNYEGMSNIPAFYQFNVTCDMYAHYINTYLDTLADEFLKQKSIHFFGHSWGGTVAMEMQRRFTDDGYYVQRLDGVSAFAPFMYCSDLMTYLRARCQESTTYRDKINSYVNQVDLASMLMQDGSQGFGRVNLFAPTNAGVQIMTADALMNTSFNLYTMYVEHTITQWASNNIPHTVFNAYEGSEQVVFIRTQKTGKFDPTHAGTDAPMPVYLYHVEEDSVPPFYVDVPVTDGSDHSEYEWKIMLDTSVALKDLIFNTVEAHEYFSMGLVLSPANDPDKAVDVYIHPVSASNGTYIIRYDQANSLIRLPDNSFRSMLKYTADNVIIPAQCVKSAMATYYSGTYAENLYTFMFTDVLPIDHRRRALAIPQLPPQLQTLEELTAYYIVQIRPEKYPHRQLAVHRDEHWADSSRQGTGYDGMRILLTLDDGVLDANTSGIIDEWQWQVVNLGNHNFTFTVPGTGTRLSGNAQFGHTYYPLDTDNVNTRLVHLETDANNVEYYAIVFENDNNILGLRDAFGTLGIDPATSFTISPTIPTDADVKDWVNANSDSLVSFKWILDFESGPYSYASAI